MPLSGFYSNGTCWEKAVGLETGVIPDNNITASSNIDPSPPSAARLGSHVGWCPMNLTNAFLQVDLGNAYYICAVATQGRQEGNFGYVKHYAIQLSLNGKNWTEYEQVQTYYFIREKKDISEQYPKTEIVGPKVFLFKKFEREGLSLLVNFKEKQRKINMDFAT